MQTFKGWRWLVARTRTPLAWIVFVVFLSAPCWGQCGPQWLVGPGVPGVMGDTISGGSGARAAVNWDPDGGGPLPSRLVVAGGISVAGSSSVNRMASWDGQAWSPMVAPAGYVYGLMAVGPDLYACGSGGLSHWTDAGWTVEYPVGTNAVIGAMCVSQGDLVIERTNQAPFQWTATVLRRHNGVWSQLGGTFNNGVSFLGEIGGVLTATGYFTNIDGEQATFVARWDGLQWRGLPVNLNGGHYLSNVVDAACEYQGDLIVGGEFSITGSDVAFLARWDGTAWHAYGAPPSYTSSKVNALLTKDGRVYVGDFYGFWYVSGDALTVAGYRGGYDDGVACLAELGQQVIVVGGFHTMNYAPVDGVAAFDGTAWSGMGSGTNDRIDLVTVAGDRVVASGRFLTIDGVATLHVAAFDGSRWQPLGDPSFTYNGVRTLGAFGDDPVVFDYLNRVDRWDGSAWHPLGVTPWSGVANAFATYGGELIAAGSFSSAGGRAANNIARWSGTAWEPLGAGTNGVVNAMIVYGGDLVVGGSFTVAGGVTAKGVARWDGAGWSPLGGGCPGLSNATHFAIRNGIDLMVGGRFDPDSRTPAPGQLARWDGSAWSRIVTGTNAWMNGMTVLRNDLFVAWYGASTISRWDGSRWWPVAGTPYSTHGLVTYGNEIFAIHDGVTAGGHVSAYYSRWSPLGAPWVSGQPRPVESPCGGSASFSVEAPSGYSDVQYQWRREGEPLEDGPTPWGSVVSGARTSVLTISGVGGADARVYSVDVSNSCNGDLSASVALTLSTCCSDPDFNHDGVPGTDADIEAFFACLAGSCCLRCGSADFNADGDAGTDADIEAFFRVLAGGSC